MKYILPLLFLFLPVMSQAQETQKISIEDNSIIYLKGVSNIHDFSCELQIDPVDMSLCYSSKQGDLFFKDNKLTLSVDKFDCENRHMTRDLKKTLKIDQHPLMYLELERLLDVWDTGSKKEVEMLITIAGVTNKYRLTATAKPVDKDTYRVEMTDDFDMHDFDIEPPTALMGLIKVKETITIDLILFVTIR